MKTVMCQYMLAKFPRVTFNKNVFGTAQLVTCRHTQWWRKQAHIYSHSVNKQLHRATFFRK